MRRPASSVVDRLSITPNVGAICSRKGGNHRVGTRARARRWDHAGDDQQAVFGTRIKVVSG